MRKIIFFELNEVPFRIIDEYCQRHPHSSLATHLPECRQYETYAEDLVLSPWVTWPTVHRGVTDRDHGIHHLGQDLSEADKAFPPLWKTLASQGVKAGVFGSLHSYPLPTNVECYAFYVPDTFASGSECFPKELSVFQEFNLLIARHSSRNVSTIVPWKLALRLLAHRSRIGLRTSTLMDSAKQVLSEKFKSWRRIRRRTYQAVLAFDVFMKQVAETKPDFATFFTNHVASSLHRFWAAAHPQDYREFRYDRDWVLRYRHEIEFTMRKFDSFFARLVRFIDRNPDYSLWLVSSMGQAATTAEPLKTQLYATDIKQFMKTLGIGEGEWRQRAAMAPLISVYVATHQAPSFRSALNNLMVDRHPLEYEEGKKGFFSISFGHVNLDSKPPYAIFNGKKIHYQELGLANIPVEDKTKTNAYHIPAGSLLIYDPKDHSPKTDRTQISTVEIASAILRNFSLGIPSYMSHSGQLR